MKSILRKYPAILAFIVVLSGSSYGQADRIMVHGGFTYEFMRQQVDNQQWLYPYYGLSVGMNYVLIHSNDQISLGVDPNINFSVGLSNAYFNIFTQTPVYLVGKLGGGATKYNEQKFGIGAGIGFAPTFVYYKSFDFPPSIVKEIFVNPGAIAQVSISGRRSDVTIRVNWSIAPAHKEISGYDVKYSTFGIGLLYSFM